MKKLLVRILFWNAPAEGALFALTFAVIGSILWLGLLHVLVLLDIVSFAILPGRDGEISTVWLVWGVGQLLIWLYSLFVFVRACRLLGKAMRQTGDFRPMWWSLPVLLCGVAGGIGVYCTGGAIRHTWKTVFCWNSISGNGNVHIPIFRRFQDFFGFSNNGWIWIFCGALLLLLVAYLLTAKLFAAGGKIPLRRTFGRATQFLWGIFAAGYIVSLGCALYASSRSAGAEAALARRFQRPLTAGGLERMYRENGPIDGAFWKKNLAAHDKVSGTLTVGAQTHPYWGLVLPDRLTPEILAAFEQYCKVNAETLTAWESGFDAVPPLPERTFESGNLEAIIFTQLSSIRNLARLENSRLLAALRKNNLPEALKAYTRLTNSCAYLKREPCLIGSLIWLAIENIRLRCAEELLESQLLSDSQLTELDKGLAELELTIPANHQQAIYSEAVFGLDVLYGLETGKSSMAAAALGGFRWFFPLFWVHTALDKEHLIRTFSSDDFTKIDAPSAVLKPYLLSMMLLPALHNAGNRFYALTARVRAARTLIRAEAYRRRHGKFPAELDDLPTDPFTGKPMSYRVGQTNAFETFWRKTDKGFTSDSRIRAVNAVQVWSVGPDRKDNGGADYQEPGTKIRYDDVRALIRLPETKEVEQ